MAAPSAAILKRYQKNARTFFEPTRRREAPQEPRKLGHGNPGGKSGSRPLLAGNITKYSHFKRLRIFRDDRAEFFRLSPMRSEPRFSKLRAPGPCNAFYPDYN
jgi:hypothetical protein